MLSAGTRASTEEYPPNERRQRKQNGRHALDEKRSQSSRTTRRERKGRTEREFAVARRQADLGTTSADVAAGDLSRPPRPARGASRAAAPPAAAVGGRATGGTAARGAAGG